MDSSDSIDDAIQDACRGIGDALRQMDAALCRTGVDVSFSIRRHESGEWAVFASADVPETRARRDYS